MEEKKKNKKLVLEKEVISTLNGTDMNYIIGGFDDYFDDCEITNYYCVTKKNCIDTAF